MGDYMGVIEKEKRLEDLKTFILECKEKNKKVELDEIPFEISEIEQVCIELFSKETNPKITEDCKEKISLKELKRIGIPSGMIDSIAVKRWFTDNEIQYIANISDLYWRAFVIIGRIYAERTDRSNNPQSWHLLSVSDALDFKNEKVVGLLHDVVEDGYLTLDSLRYIFKFPESIVQDVSILTRDKELYPTYDSYIRKRVLPSNSLRVLKTKLKDMLNNQSEKRTKNLPPDAKHKAQTKYIPYIPLFEERIEEVKLERKRSKKK